MTISSYVIIFAALLVILILVLILVSNKKCKECGSKLSNKRKYISKVVRFGKFHEHSRIDGEKDRRFKYNSTYWTFMVHFNCPNCKDVRIEYLKTKNPDEIRYLLDKSEKTSKPKSVVNKLEKLKKEREELEKLLKDL